VAATKERVLTLRELNRATLARQLLLERKRISVVRAIERVGGLQAQWPPSPYIGLWSRLEGFKRSALTRALERRQVVKATLMRATLHLVSAEDYLSFGDALNKARIVDIDRRLVLYGIDADVDALARRASRVAAAAPRSRPELLALLGQKTLRSDARQPWVIWHALQARAELVHTPDGAAWRKTTGRSSFVPVRTWLGRSPEGGTPALERLVRRYLGAFGPATIGDLSQWSGLTIGMLREALERLVPDLRTFQTESGAKLLDLSRSPLPDGDVPAPVRFLPMWDSVLLAHADRTRVISDEYRRIVIRKNGEVQQTFLVDGVVAGTWRIDDGRVLTEPFEPLPRRVMRELEAEAKRLAAFVGPEVRL
jgi:hypothetical protein